MPLMQNYPALHPFALALLALFAKTSLTSIAQVVCRFRSGRYLNPEDAALVGRQSVASEAPLVQRFAYVWRNDVENLPLFLALALTYVLIGATAVSATWLFSGYVLIRYLHTIIYLRGMQPWRTVLYLSGLALCWVIAVGILVKILG